MIQDIVFYGIIAVCWLLCQCFGNSLGITWILPVLSVLWLLFDKVLWRCISPKIIRQYKLYGNWHGTLYYKYRGKTGSKEVRLTIKQTFLNTAVHIKTDEMVGKSLVSKWHFDQDKLFYIYQTDPKTEVKDQNPIQYGGAQIKINPDNMNEIRIEYWTDRNTKGHMELKRC